MFDLEGACVGCDHWHTLDDLGMCDTCAAKLDRDLIRQRAWDYSATAFGCDPKDYEALRQTVIDTARPMNCWPRPKKRIANGASGDGAEGW